MLNWCKSKNLDGNLVVLLLISTFLPFYYSWAIIILLILIDLCKHRGKLYIFKMPGRGCCYLFIIFGTIVGFIATANNQNSSWAFIRDIIRVSSVPVYWYWGCKKSANKTVETVLSTAYFFCGLYSIISVLIRFRNFIQVGGGLYAFRASGSINEYVVAIGLYLTFFKSSKVNGTYISRYLDIIIGFFIITAFAISFSRSSILILACMIICNGFKNMNSIIRLGIISIISVTRFLIL